MSENRFDQAARYVARYDPQGFLGWLIDGFAGALHFARWLDTRTAPPPGQADQTADRVALLRELVAVVPPWLLLLEFQTEPDPAMFGRLLRELGRLWDDHRPDDTPSSRYQVAAAVVNLTGTSRSVPASRSHALPVPGRYGLTLTVCERYLGEESAAEALDGVAAGAVTRGVLPLIPLMLGGGEAGTMERWKELAGREPESRRRGELGMLTLVMAELGGAVDEWKRALEGWNVRESKVWREFQEMAKAEARAEIAAIMREEGKAEGREEGKAEGREEGKAEGREEGRAAALRQTLQTVLKRFHPLPPEFAARLDAIADPDRLLRLVDQALDVARLEDLPV
ncbi:MAG: hypothetical protein ACRC33_15020 [Gemmataceae bacterium]